MSDMRYSKDNKKVNKSFRHTHVLIHFDVIPFDLLLLRLFSIKSTHVGVIQNDVNTTILTS